MFDNTLEERQERKEIFDSMLPPKRLSQKDLEAASAELTLRSTLPPQNIRHHESSAPFEEERRMARQETIRSLHEHRKQTNNYSENRFHIERQEQGVTYLQEDGLVKSHKASLRGLPKNYHHSGNGSWFDQQDVLRNPTYQQHPVRHEYGMARQTQSFNPVTYHDDQHDRRQYERQKTSISLKEDYGRPGGSYNQSKGISKVEVLSSVNLKNDKRSLSVWGCF